MEFFFSLPPRSTSLIQAIDYGVIATSKLLSFEDVYPAS
jgi:hypothetical protein